MAFTSIIVIIIIIIIIMITIIQTFRLFLVTGRNTV